MSTVLLLKEYHFGDMLVQYYIDNETKNVELMLLPEDTVPVAWSEKKQAADSLVQLKITGDTYSGAYAGGVTLRQSESAMCLKYREQRRK
jgi:alpha-galactosidase